MPKGNQSKKNTVINLIKKVMLEVEGAEPTKERMIEDIKMMNFKIRSLAGDVFVLTGANAGLVEAIWRIGKIEQIVGNSIDNLDARQQETFFVYLEQLHFRAQQKIIEEQSQSSETIEKINQLRLEIFREKKQRDKN